VKKAVERSTLNQVGKKPFHLKAFWRRASRGIEGRSNGRSGDLVGFAHTVETRSAFAGVSPDRNREQRTECRRRGEYFPEWLRETSVALIEPVPSLDQVLQQVKDAEVRKMAGSTYFSWTMMSTDGKVEKGMGAGLAVTESTGLLFYGGGLGWGGLYKDYKSFHGRMVAQTVSVGSPEVTAKVTTLEDLRDIPPGIFDAEAAGGDVPLLRTAEVEETLLRKNCCLWNRWNGPRPRMPSRRSDHDENCCRSNGESARAGINPLRQSRFE